ncbi:hypothetical protein [Cupriavidus necator]|uniref:hypothetical protein n=1 Tax=Cupriavidus necator TaxID=106590 RepID=UPI00339D7045
MRTLLYFRLNDVDTARRAQTRFGELAQTPGSLAGPWFSRRDSQPAEGLPAPDAGRTTYRDAAALGGGVIGALLTGWLLFRYGTPASVAAGAVAYVGGAVLGALIGGWLGTVIGAKVTRAGLRRQRRQMAEGQILMVCACASDARERICRVAQDLGAASVAPNIDPHNVPHNGLLPNRGWLADRHWPAWPFGHGHRAVTNRN